MTRAISADGLALIQRFEGFHAEPTPLPGGGWVVGHGHVRIGETGEAVTRAEAAALLALDLAPVERLVNVLVSKPLAQSQFDALVSFTFSIGDDAFAGSQVLRRINSGDFVAAACAMDAWRKGEVDGELEVVDALVRRRAAEKAHFLRDLPLESAPSAFMCAKLDHAAAILGAPVKQARAPAAAAVAAARPQFVEGTVVSLLVKNQPVLDAGVRLTEILRSEPGTEAALQAQVANDFDSECAGEIVTAHAKPVARPLDRVREATRLAFEAQQAACANDRGWLALLTRGLPKRRGADAVRADQRFMRAQGADEGAVSRFQLLSFIASIEHVGLCALLLFGLGLISVGASLLFGGDGGMVEIAAAAALVTPGLAAALMAAYGLWRAPRTA